MAWWIFQNVVITAFLVAIVLVICRVGRIGPVGRHALWVLVLVKFVTPPVVEWPWAMPDPFGLSALERSVDHFAPRVRVGSMDAAGVDLLEPPDASNVVEPRAGRNVLEPRDFSFGESSLSTIWPLIPVIWILGSLCVLGIECMRLMRLARRVRAAERPDQAIVSRVAELARRFDLPPLRVVSLPGSTSPVVWCLGRPVLLWPTELPADSTDACIDGLLVHELAHIKRRDHLVGWIELAAGVVWWWNPLFW